MIAIEKISSIKIERTEKLLVRVPSGIDEEERDSMRESLLKFFGLTTDRLLIYSGEIEFNKISS